MTWKKINDGNNITWGELKENYPSSVEIAIPGYETFIESRTNSDVVFCFT